MSRKPNQKDNWVKRLNNSGEAIGQVSYLMLNKKSKELRGTETALECKSEICTSWTQYMIVFAWIIACHLKCTLIKTIEKSVLAYYLIKSKLWAFSIFM